MTFPIQWMEIYGFGIIFHLKYISDNNNNSAFFGVTGLALIHRLTDIWAWMSNHQNLNVPVSESPALFFINVGIWYQRMPLEDSYWCLYEKNASIMCIVNFSFRCNVIKLSIYECPWHYNDVIMGAISSQITSLTIFYSTVYSVADQRKHESSASLAFVRGIHRGTMNSPHKWPETRKMSPFDDVIMENVYKILIQASVRAKFQGLTHPWETTPGIILSMHLANERRRYILTSFPIGWAHIQKYPCYWLMVWSLLSCMRWHVISTHINPRQNGRHFADDVIVKCTFLNEKWLFRLRFHWMMFLRVKLTIFQH